MTGRTSISCGRQTIWYDAVGQKKLELLCFEEFPGVNGSARGNRME